MRATIAPSVFFLRYEAPLKLVQVILDRAKRAQKIVSKKKNTALPFWDGQNHKPISVGSHPLSSRVVFFSTARRAFIREYFDYKSFVDTYMRDQRGPVGLWPTVLGRKYEPRHSQIFTQGAPRPKLRRGRPRFAQRSTVLRPHVLRCAKHPSARRTTRLYSRGSAEPAKSRVMSYKVVVLIKFVAPSLRFKNFDDVGCVVVLASLCLAPLCLHTIAVKAGSRCGACAASLWKKRPPFSWVQSTPVL